ncbi:hypothetical protein CHLRE_06g261850v5 [Chlamydomonas reinhardtii]|uniref:Uncharacterized protein n=1 Tax=Chlamydomonas reinhardtii TaxID=3055 RepID=A0A2K3DMS5_CHLRE|nr:uncharacterized protein CHLRE_06g261850v5 [Chlamydomonas reinhardtii]PNW81823.1 hypothetical protein CHLRE_06g261850v5 [Chlamydomonas reinhardtii]
MKSCIRSSQGTRHPARITIQRDSTSSSVPWSTIDYHTKKKQRLADAYGNLIHSDATLLEPAVWTNDTKLALALRVVSEELGVSEDDLRRDVVQLTALMPDLVPGGPGARHADVVRVAARLGTAADCLLVLREELLDVNVSRAAAQQLPLLLLPPERLRAELQQVKALLAGCGPAGRQQLLEAHPQLLRSEAAVALLDEVARLFGLDADSSSSNSGGSSSSDGSSSDGNSSGRHGGAGEGAQTGARNEEALSGLVTPSRARAAALLGSNPDLAGMADCLRGQARGDRDPEYVADTTRASL